MYSFPSLQNYCGFALKLHDNFIKGFVSVQNTKLELSRSCTAKAHITKVYRLLFFAYTMSVCVTFIN